MKTQHRNPLDFQAVCVLDMPEKGDSLRNIGFLLANSLDKVATEIADGFAAINEAETKEQVKAIIDTQILCRIGIAMKLICQVTDVLGYQIGAIMGAVAEEIKEKHPERFAASQAYPQNLRGE